MMDLKNHTERLYSSLNIEYLAIETKTQENPGYHFSSIYN